MEMCYRGIKYNRHSVIPQTANLALAKTTETKFIGQVCQKESVSLNVIEKKTRFLGQMRLAH